VQLTYLKGGRERDSIVFSEIPPSKHAMMFASPDHDFQQPLVEAPDRVTEERPAAHLRRIYDIGPLWQPVPGAMNEPEGGRPLPFPETASLRILFEDQVPVAG
jgi:hypothetical protein